MLAGEVAKALVKPVLRKHDSDVGQGGLCDHARDIACRKLPLQPSRSLNSTTRVVSASGTGGPRFQALVTTLPERQAKRTPHQRVPW